MRAVPPVIHLSVLAVYNVSDYCIHTIKPAIHKVFMKLSARTMTPHCPQHYSE